MTDMTGRVALVIAPPQTADAISTVLTDAGCTVIIASHGSPAGAVEKATATAGRLDILIQHYPTQSREYAREIAPEAWARDLNSITETWRTAVEFAAVATPGAVVINVVSMDASASSPHRTTAAVVASGIQAMTRSLAVEWATVPIRVNTVAHGVLLTERDLAAIESGTAALDRVLLRSPGHRLHSATELAGLVRFLVNDGSQFITGQTIAIDGGWAALTQHPEGLRFP